MFKVGDEVMVVGGIQGTIMDFYYDDGNIWVVDTGKGNEIECGDDELTPANRTKPYNGNEWYIYS